MKASGKGTATPLETARLVRLRCQILLEGDTDRQLQQRLAGSNIGGFSPRPGAESHGDLQVCARLVCERGRERESEEEGVPELEHTCGIRLSPRLSLRSGTRKSQAGTRTRGARARGVIARREHPRVGPIRPPPLTPFPAPHSSAGGASVETTCVRRQRRESGTRCVVAAAETFPEQPESEGAVPGHSRLKYGMLPWRC